MLFCQPHDLGGEDRGPGNFVGYLVDEGDLVNKPRVNAGGLVDLVDGCSRAECLLDGDDSAVSGNLGYG